MGDVVTLPARLPSSVRCGRHTLTFAVFSSGCDIALKQTLTGALSWPNANV